MTYLNGHSPVGDSGPLNGVPLNGGPPSSPLMSPELQQEVIETARLAARGAVTREAQRAAQEALVSAMAEGTRVAGARVRAIDESVTTPTRPFSRRTHQIAAGAAALLALGGGFYFVRNNSGPTPRPETVATARCNDGTWSYSRSRQGACSGHGGVKVFYKGRD